MKQYLDVPSLISSDFYDNNKRLEWHTSQFKYDELAQDLYDWLNIISLSQNEKDVFDIVRPSIHSTLSSYLSHVYDYIILSNNNIKPVYSDASNVFIDKIWNNKPINSIFSIELEKLRFRPKLKNKIYSYFFKFIPKSFFDSIVVSPNTLMFDHICNMKTIRFLPLYHFKIDTMASDFSEKLSNKIFKTLALSIEKTHFHLNHDHKASVEFILKALISRAYNNFESYSGFFKGSKGIITGTGNNYYNRLVSAIAKKECVKVTRCNHGGERCFYDDGWYWDAEYHQTDTYVTYGQKWGDYATKKAQNTLADKKINIKCIGSKYHEEIYRKFIGKKTKNKNKILYIPNSFVGESRQFPYAKIIDPLLFDWQKYLIETLQNNGFDVIYKKHPKGFFQEENILGRIAKYESTDSMEDALEGVDIVLCDMAGSAFVEALCAGKKVILIDTKQRPFSLKDKLELSGAVNIINAFWENNILSIDESKLIESIKSVDEFQYENQKKLVEKYFLRKK